jgi:hypothetical protein
VPCVVGRAAMSAKKGLRSAVLLALHTAQLHVVVPRSGELSWSAWSVCVCVCVADAMAALRGPKFGGAVHDGTILSVRRGRAPRNGKVNVRAEQGHDVANHGRVVATLAATTSPPRCTEGDTMCGRYALALVSVWREWGSHVAKNQQRPSEVRQQLESAQMPVADAPGDDEVRPSYNFAPGYHGLVYRADGPGHGGQHDDSQQAEAAPVGEEGATGDTNTTYKLQAMQWGMSWANAGRPRADQATQGSCRSGRSATRTTAAR